jgi:hypothetical protein
MRDDFFGTNQLEKSVKCIARRLLEDDGGVFLLLRFFFTTDFYTLSLIAVLYTLGAVIIVPGCIIKL